MYDENKIKEMIQIITSSEFYEGDFGDVVTDIDSLLSKVKDSDINNVPKDYLQFISTIGFGELDAAFYIDDGPDYYSNILGQEVTAYQGMYIFSGDTSENLYAFDSLNNWMIVEINSEALGAFSKINTSFSDFILKKLEYIVELIKWREEN